MFPGTRSHGIKDGHGRKGFQDSLGSSAKQRTSALCGIENESEHIQVRASQAGCWGQRYWGVGV